METHGEECDGVKRHC